MFVGYSLGETDHHYFEDFFRSSCYSGSSMKNIIVSYYKENGMYDILKQLDTMTLHNIQNLRIFQNFKMFDLSN